MKQKKTKKKQNIIIGARILTINQNNDFNNLIIHSNYLKNCHLLFNHTNLVPYKFLIYLY